MNDIDVVGQEVLAKILTKLDCTTGVLYGDRSPRNVKIRQQIYSLMRSCVHPECPQLSLNRIAKLCNTNVCTVRHRIQAQGATPLWKFRDDVPELDLVDSAKESD